MSEDERRDLIARQHRALYGNESALYPTPEAAAAAAVAARRASQDVRTGSISGVRGGASPLAFDPFAHSGGEPAVQMPPREGVMLPKSPNSASSPSSNPTTFGSLLGETQQSSRTSVSSPSGSPPLGQGTKASAAAAAPIGTRPAPNAAQAATGLNKRSTTPLPSPLSFGFSANEQAKNERSTSAGPNGSVADKGVSLGSWGSNSGVWGSSKNSLGVQASVWG